VDGKRWSIGDLARATGLTVRTLHYYDEVGLVRPGERTGSGHRRYTEADVRRLYRVRALRQVGLSLDQIAAVLHRSPEDLTALRGLLADQLAELAVQAAQVSELRQRIEGLVRRLDGPDGPEPEDFMATLETMALLEAYLSREQRDRLAQRRDELGTDAVAALRSEWLEVATELRRHRHAGTPPGDPCVRELAARWDAVGTAFGTGDGDADGRIRGAVDELWRDHGPAISDQVGRSLGWDPADVTGLVDYVRRIRDGGVGSGVGLTAVASAAGRAVESSRDDRLIEDPYAEAFVRAAAVPVPLPVRWPDAEPSPQEALLLLGATYVGLRTRFFDDVLRAGPGQVVILGAGLDTRAYRLDWPSASRVFEIDQPAVLAFKDRVLGDLAARPRCDRRAVPADLRDDWPQALQDNGFDPAAPTVWIGEGVLQYLSAHDEQRLLVAVDELSAPGSRLALERSVDLTAAGKAGPGEAGRRRAHEIGRTVGVPVDQLIHADPRPDPTAWLTARGWTATDEQVAAVAARYRRSLVDPRLAGRLPAAAGKSPAAGYTVAAKRY